MLNIDQTKNSKECSDLPGHDFFEVQASNKGRHGYLLIFYYLYFIYENKYKVNHAKKNSLY